MGDFQQRHYIEIARILHDFSFGNQNKTLCEAFAHYFKRDNHRFSAALWYDACER